MPSGDICRSVDIPSGFLGDFLFIPNLDSPFGGLPGPEAGSLLSPIQTGWPAGSPNGMLIGSLTSADLGLSSGGLPRPRIGCLLSQGFVPGLLLSRLFLQVLQCWL